MPEFVLNENKKLNLSEFERGYIEAMFFTNGDIGDDNRPDLLNELGVSRITKRALRMIKSDCDRFLSMRAPTIDGESFTMRQWIGAAAVDSEYTEEQAGRDFWFTRQGHGTGFWDRTELDTATQEALTRAAKICGEIDVDVSRGWIHY